MSGSTFPDPSDALTVSAWVPASAEDRDAVLQQLDRMLAHSFFKNSRRNSALFRYLVERILRGDRNLKERVLGMEVFGREPDYDTNDDPVIRVTAGEIRRRIAQYYHEPGHDQEIRIDLPSGSYNPLFRLPTHGAAATDVQPISAKTEVARAPEVEEEAKAAAQPPRNWEQSMSSPLPDVPAPRGFLALGVAVILLVASLAAYAAFRHRVTPPTALEQFWTPVIASKLPVLICIPDLDSIFSDGIVNAAPATPFTQAMTMLGHDYRREKVAFSDSVALASLTKFLGSKGTDFRIKRSEEASLEDLKGGPVVLIAGGNNHWTMQLGKQLRFTIERDSNYRYISDASNPSSRQWAVTGGDTDPGQTVDYAVISRVFDSTTGAVLVTAAGLHHNGTQAAGICLATESCLQQAAKIAPGDWSKGNVQFVIETTVLGDEPGQARVVAGQVW